jgi:creatinine amidohydrolase/Fe(II)-dependent formamide hydrolase-like protein
MVLGKHNVRVKALAGMIAKELGNAIVAPVVAYVPEGNIHPPASHMRFPGTISIPVSAFESLLEGAARSFKQHGFRRIVFLGDHGGYQRIIEKTAQRLNREWDSDPSCRVYALSEYYQAGQTTFAEDLKARGFNEAQIGVHAGLLDTSLALAIDPKLVRIDQLGENNKKPSEQDGVRGDPRAATKELGEIGLKRIVEASVQAIRKLPPLDSNLSRNPGSSKQKLDPPR